MANTIRLKKSSVASKVPFPADLDYGELALNYADGRLYFKDSSGANIKYFPSSDQISSALTIDQISSALVYEPSIARAFMMMGA